LQIVQDPTISTIISTFFILIFFERMMKVLFIPKNLAKDLYIESPAYYIPGLIIGMLHGYILYSLVAFTLLFGGSVSIVDKINDSFLQSVMNGSYKVARFFVIRRFDNELQSVFERFNKSGNKKALQSTVEGAKTIEGKEDKDQQITKTLSIISQLKDTTEEECNIIASMLAKLSSASAENVYKRISYMERNETITKNAAMYIVVHAIAIAAKEDGLLPSTEENKLIIKTSFDVFLKLEDEKIISMFGKPEQVKRKISRPSQNTPIANTTINKPTRAETTQDETIEAEKYFATQENYDLPELKRDKKGKRQKKKSRQDI
jgi:hypothetical protein